MKILLAAPGYPSDVAGEAGLARELRRAGRTAPAGETRRERDTELAHGVWLERQTELSPGAELPHGAEQSRGAEQSHGAERAHRAESAHDAGLVHEMDLAHEADLAHERDLSHAAELAREPEFSPEANLSHGPRPAREADPSGQAEFPGETELEVQALARSLVARGITVVVVAGTSASAPEPRVVNANDGGVLVQRIERADRHIDHWQKSASTAVARLFRAIVRNQRPDVVHVHGWRRLTRDLVQVAASEGTPAVVTLHDPSVTCLITTRVRPDTRASCTSELGANPCLACAQRVPPKTPWVPIEAQYMAFAERERDLLRELSLARAVLVPSVALVETLKRYWPASANHVDFTVQTPLRMGSLTAVGARAGIDDRLEIYARAQRSGPPAVSAPSSSGWYTLRMREFAETEWDRNLLRTTALELGPPEA